MPRFDRTGPRGLGPKTGRCFGNCRCAPLTKAEEKKLLESELLEINKRIKELE